MRWLLVLSAAGLLAGCGDNGTEPPFLSGVNGAYSPEGPVGSTVLAEGINFGTTADSLVFTSAGGTEIPAPTSTWLDSYIVGQVPQGAASGNIFVETGGGPSAAYLYTVTPQDSFTSSGFGWHVGSLAPGRAERAGALPLPKLD